MQKRKKMTSAHKKAGKRMKTIDNIAKTLDAVVFFVKYFVIPVGTWLWSDNAWLRIAAILFSAICAVRDSQKKP